MNFGSIASQYSLLLPRLSKVLSAEKPDLVTVVGDANPSFAASLTSALNQIPVAHVEAGYRSMDYRMPEEINRVLTDKLSTLLFAPTGTAKRNLLSEGFSPEQIFFVGNIMIDSLKMFKEKYEKSRIMDRLNLEKKGFCLVTIHRRENVTDQGNLSKIVKIIFEVQKRIKTIFPIHPLTRKKMAEINLLKKIENMENLLLAEPLPYFDFIKLEKESLFVVTDSGGVQEETTYFQKPCLTLRYNTERVETVLKGTNRLVGLEIELVKKYIRKIEKGEWFEGTIPIRWDGETAARIRRILENWSKPVNWLNMLEKGVPIKEIKFDIQWKKFNL